MANTRHVIVIRKDLNMSAGLMAAQVAHISDAFMRDRIENEKPFSDEELSWMKTPYIAVLSVDNFEELNIIMEEAKNDNLLTYEWSDLMYSTNLNRAMPQTVVGCSIGPADSDKIKSITGNLPLA